MMCVSSIGYGMGKKDFEAANCVRAMMGETDSAKDEMFELNCNVDDMTAEEIGFALELCFEATQVGRSSEVTYAKSFLHQLEQNPRFACLQGDPRLDVICEKLRAMA